MVSRACKGRRLTRRVQLKILAALNAAAEEEYSLSDLFNYRGLKRPTFFVPLAPFCGK
jgi:hypothetical protein